MQPNLQFSLAHHNQVLSIKTFVEPIFKDFCKIATQVPKPPQNPRCLNLAEALVKHYENPSDEDSKQLVIQSIKCFNRIDDVPKTKGKLCGGLLYKGDKAYRCYDCMTEENSVVCPDCFELDKHMGHEYERFEVYGGCCDCGDIQKWKQEGFCSEHSKKEETDIIIDKKITRIFIQEQIYAIGALLELYSKYLFLKQTVEDQNWQKDKPQRLRDKIREQVCKIVKEELDFYGEKCIVQLLTFNKAGIYANKMTGILFDEIIPQRGEKTVMEHLFTMTESKKIAGRVSDLCITMFPLNGFREKVTQLYITLYNSKPTFPPSAYSHLSSQLLTSHMVITKLVQEGRIEAIRYFPVCQKYEDIQSVCDGFLRYYYDIRYLSKLYGSAAIDYFKFYSQKEMFHTLGYYRVLFDNFEQAIDYYGMQEIYLDRIIPVVKVIQRDSTMQISNMVLKQLYHFIVTQTTSDHNKLRPQQRLFTIILFVRLNGDLSKLDDPDTMNELFIILQINKFKEDMSRLLVNLRSIFLTASKILENSNEVHAKYTFYSYYLKKSHLLFNSDAILLKIIIKMCIHYNQNYENFDFNSILVEGDNNPVTVIKSTMNQHNQHMDIQDMTEQEKQQIEQNQIRTINAIKHLKSYISLLNQAMFSDLSELALMCALQPTDFQILKKYQIKKLSTQQLAMHYYKCLLRTQDTVKIPIKIFKKTAEMFFKEEQVFKQFVSKHRDLQDPMKLVRINDGGPKINFYYFKSISAIQPEKYKMGFGNPPYMKWKSHQFLESFISPIKEAIKVSKFIQSNSFGKVSQMKGTFMPYLILEIWKIAKITGSPAFINLMSESLKDQQILKQTYGLGNQIASVITSGSQLEQNKQDNDRRKQQLKRRLQEKKMKMKEKMKENTDKFYDKMQNEESSFEFSQNSMTQTPSIDKFSGNQCCLCKEGPEKQYLYLLSLVTFTTGNGWIGIDHQKNLIPLFDSCGHAVHLSCHYKIRRKSEANRVFNYCHLCKSSSNILLPQKVTIEEEDARIFVQDLEKVYQTLEIPFDSIKVPINICKSIVFEIILKGILQENEFKKNVKIYSLIFNLYKHLYKVLGIYQHQKSIGKLVCFNDTPDNLQNIITSVTSAVNNQPISVGLSQNFDLYTGYLISLLKCQNQPNMCTIDPPEVNLIKATIVFPNLELNLGQMNSTYRGKCPQCGLITNNQMICLSCPNFITCSNCQKVKITDHSGIYHSGIAVFIKTSTGELIYLMRNRYWKFESLYEDYMGRFYTESSKHRQEFNLNKRRYYETQKDILCCKIEQKVRYKEVATKTVHNSDIY